MATEIVRAPSTRALGHAGEHAAGAELGELGDAERRQRQQAVLPAHRAAQLGRQQARPLVARGRAASASTLETTGTSVSRVSASAIALRSRSRAGAMNGVWNAPETCSGITFLAPSSLACDAGRGDALGRTGDDDLAGRVEVGDPHVGVGAAAGHLDLVVVEAEHGGHRARAGRCRRRASRRRARRRGARPRRSRARRWRSSAVYSPRLWPAQKLGSMPSRSTASSTIRLDTNVVSWALRVSLQLVGVGIEQQARDVALGDLARPRRPAPSSRGRPRGGPCPVAATPGRGT